jgi:hypothetical protein
MAEHNYKLEGTGTTTRAAQRVLTSSRGDLIGKLKKAKTSTELEVVRTHFSGNYKLKAGKTVQAGSPNTFRVESDDSWANLRLRATAHGNIRKYDGQFKVEEYLRLTEKQLSASSKRTPGGRKDQPYSSLDNLTL